MKRVIITGCSGTIGAALIRLFIKKGIYVLAMVRPKSPKNKNILRSHYVTICECEISKLRKYIEGTYDVFFCLAWTGTFGNVRKDVYLQN